MISNPLGSRHKTNVLPFSKMTEKGSKIPGCWFHFCDVGIMAGINVMYPGIDPVSPHCVLFLSGPLSLGQSQRADQQDYEEICAGQ